MSGTPQFQYIHGGSMTGGPQSVGNVYGTNITNNYGSPPPSGNANHTQPNTTAETPAGTSSTEPQANTPEGVANILILSSNPRTQMRLDLSREREALEEALRQARLGNLYRVYEVDSCRPDEITRALDLYRPKILHFSGHGEPNGICFEGEDGRGVIVDRAEFGRLLGTQEGLELIVLNACYTDHQARALRDVGFVICMDGIITDQAALGFSREFYRALGGGRDYEGAFRRAQPAVRMTTRLDARLLRPRFAPPGPNNPQATAPNRSTHIAAIAACVHRLQREEDLLVEGDQKRQRTHLTLDAWNIYDAIYYHAMTRDGHINFYSLQACLADKAPNEAMLRTTWQLFQGNVQLPAPKSVVIAVLYIVHLEEWYPGGPLHTGGDLRSGEIERYRAMAEWVRCYCRTSQCGLQWNFTATNYGMYRGVPGRKCDAVQFHESDLQSASVAREQRLDRAVKRLFEGQRAKFLEMSRCWHFEKWMRQGLDNCRMAVQPNNRPQV